MNLIHKTSEGIELWLGDYYAATNINLLKQKKMLAVIEFSTYFSLLRLFWESSTLNSIKSNIKQLTLSTFLATK
jgi:hypothetical protein